MYWSTNISRATRTTDSHMYSSKTTARAKAMSPTVFSTSSTRHVREKKAKHMPMARRCSVFFPVRTLYATHAMMAAARTLGPRTAMA